jgi:hypothetical protein
VRQRDRQRHQLGVSEQAKPNIMPWSPAPCASSDVLGVALAQLDGAVHALGDVGRLRADRDAHAAGRAVEALLRRVVADAEDRLAHDGRDVGVRLVVTSPATCTWPVVISVSTATRLRGSCASRASRMPSLIWSAILSGWPSVTDSEVNRRRATVLLRFVESFVPRKCSHRRTVAVVTRPTVADLRIERATASQSHRPHRLWEFAECRRAAVGAQDGDRVAVGPKTRSDARPR